MQTHFLNLLELYPSKTINLNCDLCDYAIREEINVNDNNNKIIIGLIESATAYLKAKKLALSSYQKASTIIQPFLRKEIGAINQESMDDGIRAFLLQSKISVDLLVCLVKALETKRVPKSKYPDISAPKSGIQEINNIFKNLRNTPWFQELKVVRDKIIHRGFQATCQPVYRQLESNRLDIYLSKPSVQIIKTPIIPKQYLGFPFDMHGLSYEIKVREPLNLEQIIRGYCQDIPDIEKKLSKLVRSNFNFKIFGMARGLGHDFKDLTSLVLE